MSLAKSNLSVFSSTTTSATSSTQIISGAYCADYYIKLVYATQSGGTSSVINAQISMITSL